MQNSLQLQVVNNFEKKLHFKICCLVLNPPWFILGLLSLYTIFLLVTFLNINGTSTLHTDVCLTKKMSVMSNVLVDFGEIFALFLGNFIDDCEHHLITVNAYLCGRQKKGYVYWSSCKTLVSNCAND